MGKVANVSRWLSIFAVAGSSACTRANAESTSCSVWNISTFQSKNKSTSAEPRLVIERTCCRPGTLFTASSSGRVMVTIIWSMGITPLSTPTMMRGKSVVGKTETGIVNARYAPTQAVTMIRNNMDWALRANQKEGSPAACGGRRAKGSWTLMAEPNRQQSPAAGSESRSVRASRLVVGWISALSAVRLRGIRLGRTLYLHFGIIRQAVGASGHHAVALLQAGDHLHILPLPDASAHRLLVRFAVCADDHHRGLATFAGKQRGGRNNEGVRNLLRHNLQLHCAARTQLLFWVRRLHPYLNRGAVGIKRRAHQRGLRRKLFLRPRGAHGRHVAGLEQCRLLLRNMRLGHDL